MSPAVRFHVVRDAPPAAADSTPDAGDLVLVSALFGLNVVPVLGELTGFGHWSAGIVGFATAAAILTGRELASEVRALLRSRG